MPITPVYSSSGFSVADGPVTDTNQRIRTIYERILAIYRKNEQALKFSADRSRSESGGESAELNTAEQADAQFRRFFEGEELLVSVSANYVSRGTLLGIVSETGIRFGLSEFCDVLEFPISYTSVPVFAKGWYFSPTKSFELTQLPDGSLSVIADKRSFLLAPKGYAVEDDLFIELEDLAKWFGLKFYFNEEVVGLAFNSDIIFPAEMRLSRQKRQGLLGKTRENFPIAPLKESDYQLVSPPLIDMQTFSSYSASKCQAGASSSSQHSNYSLLSSQDFAYFNSEFFLAGNDVEALSSARLTLERQSPEGELLGPLHATKISIGDVAPVKAVGGATQNLTRGAFITNRPLNQLIDNESVNLVGEAQAGWDVELYRNGILIAQQLNVSDGRYEFNDTELVFGENDFEILLYGPQGQRLSRRESYVVDQNAVGANQAIYSMSLVQVGDSVFNVEDQIVDESSQGTLISSLVTHGVNDFLSINAGSAQFRAELGERESAYSLGAGFSLGKYGLLGAQIGQTKNSSQNMSLNYRTRWKETSYAASISESTGVQEESAEETKSQRLTAKMSGKIRLPKGLGFADENQWQSFRKPSDEDSDSTESSNTLFNRIGLKSSWRDFANTLSWRDEVQSASNITLDADGSSLSGSLAYRKGFGRIYTRFSASYLLQPVSELAGLSGVATYNWYNGSNLQFRYDYAVARSEHRAGIRINWKLDDFEVSTSASYRDDGSWYAGAGLRFSFGYDPLGNQLFGSRRSLSQGGVVAVRVFDDLNLYSNYDDEEPLLGDVEVKAVHAYRITKTESGGMAVIKPIYGDIKTDIVVESVTRDGGYLLTANQDVAIASRKGFLDQVEIPMVKAA